MSTALFWALLVLLLSPYCTSLPPSQSAEQLLKCYNFNQTWRTGEFKDFLAGQPSRLHLHRVLWSTKKPAAAARSLLAAGDDRSGRTAAGAVHTVQLSGKEKQEEKQAVVDERLQDEHVSRDAARHLLDLPAPLMTIVTAATPGRLDTLAAQCSSWPGPLAAALYVPLVHGTGEQLEPSARAELAQVEAKAQAMFDEMEASTSACALKLLLLTELVAGGDDVLRLLLPINTLRNAAMLAADTPLVAMVDVDLLPSASLAQEVLHDSKKGAEIQDACQRRRQVFVLPAFETHKRVPILEGTGLVGRLVKGPKAELTAIAQNEQVIVPFAKYVYARGHNATDYPAWYRTTEAYRIEYQINYEPWFIADRCTSLPYDVRFRGYGWNKVQQVSHVAASNFTFMVHPTAFLVHRPHEKSGAQGLYNAAGSKARGKQGKQGVGASVPPHKQFHRKVAAMRHTSIRDMKRGTYLPVLDQESMHCRQVLGWWADDCKG